MKSLESENKRRKLELLGYLILIGGIFLAFFSYFFLGVNHYFYDLDGTLGLSSDFWTAVGGLTWFFVIMLILTYIVLKLDIECLKKVTFSRELKWVFIAIFFAVLFFGSIEVFGEVAVFTLCFFVFLPLGGVFSILNGRRFIKYEKWYLDPRAFDMLFYKPVGGEETLAWMEILAGIGALFLFIGFIVWAIFSI